MKVVRVIEPPSKTELYLIPLTCECGTIFYLEYNYEYIIEVDFSYEGVLALCPTCKREVRHALPLRSKEIILYKAIKEALQQREGPLA